MTAPTPTAATVPANPPFAPGAFMWRKAGPLPVWGYAIGLLAVLLIWAWLRRGKAANQTATAQAGQAADSATVTNQRNRAPIFIVPQPAPAQVQTPITVTPSPVPITVTAPDQPAGMGRDNPPGVPTTPAPVRTGPVLQQGSRGASVVTLQSLLNTHGAHLATDGIFGPLTAQAVRNFQQQVGIAVDGIVGPVTWSRL